MTGFYQPDLSENVDSPFVRDGGNKLARRSTQSSKRVEGGGQIPDHSAFSRACNERFGDSAIFRACSSVSLGPALRPTWSVAKALLLMPASLRPTPTSITRSPARSGPRILMQCRRGARSGSILATLDDPAYGASSDVTYFVSPLERCAMRIHSPSGAIAASRSRCCRASQAHSEARSVAPSRPEWSTVRVHVGSNCTKSEAPRQACSLLPAAHLRRAPSLSRAFSG